MATPSVTLRTLKNEDTGIDISVPRFKEEEAPLGGVSILYEISVLTKLDLFKTRLHKSGDVVHFTIFKAYREIDDLFNKLSKKYPKAGLPPVPKSISADKYTHDEKVEALDRFMNAVAKDIQICHSSLFTQFIGINSHRLPSFTLPKDESSDLDDAEADGASTERKDVPEDIFPKMKVSKPSVPESPKNIDLFEEAKLTKDSRLFSTDAKRDSSHGLFDDFEDENLFSSKPVEKVPVLISQEKTEVKAEVKVEPRKKEKKAAQIENVDDSQIIIKDRKFGDVSLFEDQDLGDSITKEEEALFLVISPTSGGKKNLLLLSDKDAQEEKGAVENLDELLNLSPLPNTPVSTMSTAADEPDVSKPERPKPVPLPRKKSLGKADLEGQAKPEVMPRKAFPPKTEEATQKQVPRLPPKPSVRPPVPNKPAITQAKPAVPTKPKPPPTKPKPNLQMETDTASNLDAANANQTENSNNVINLANDLKELDILKYIEQEEKALDSELDLFG